MPSTRRKAPLRFEFASSSHLDITQFLRNLKIELAAKLELDAEQIKPLPLGLRRFDEYTRKRSVFESDRPVRPPQISSGGVNADLVDVRIDNGEKIERVGLGLYPEYLGAGMAPVSWDDTSLAPVPVLEATKTGKLNQTVATVEVRVWIDFLPERRRFFGWFRQPALTLRELRKVALSAAAAVS